MTLVVIEGMILAVGGSVLGLILGHGVIEMIGQFTPMGANMALSGGVFLAEIWLVWAAFLACSLVACLIPAYEAYKTDIRQTLTHY